MEKWQPIPERVLNANKVITADTVYSASIFDHDAIHAVIKKVCDVDHLPDTTTYESLLLMRDAWDAVDIYVYLARWYKLLTHILYTIFLSVAVIIVLGTISQMRTRVENHEVYGQDVKVDDEGTHIIVGGWVPLGPVPTDTAWASKSTPKSTPRVPPTQKD